MSKLGNYCNAILLQINTNNANAIMNYAKSVFFSTIMDSVAHKRHQEELHQTEIRRQIAALQAQLVDVSNTPPPQPSKKRTQESVLAPASPSPSECPCFPKRCLDSYQRYQKRDGNSTNRHHLRDIRLCYQRQPALRNSLHIFPNLCRLHLSLNLPPSHRNLIHVLRQSLLARLASLSGLP